MNTANARRLFGPGVALGVGACLLWLAAKGVSRFSGSADFMPHGYCYLWNPLILRLHVISDGLIALSYYCIPIILIYFVRKNRDLPFSRIFWMFGAFILACGTTHLMEIWNVWHGSYLLAGVLKAITAAVSIITAAMLVPLVPMVLSLPGRKHLEERNRELKRAVANREDADQLRERLAASKLRIELSVATSGAEALEFLHQRGRFASASRPDLILLDLNLPGIDGRAVLADIKGDADLKRTPVCILTSSAAESDVVQGYNLGANCYVVKPIDFKTFQNIVQAVEGFWFTIVKLPSRPEGSRTGQDLGTLFDS